MLLLLRLTHIVLNNQHGEVLLLLHFRFYGPDHVYSLQNSLMRWHLKMIKKKKMGGQFTKKLSCWKL